MNRGDIFLVKKPGKADPKRQRAFVVVSHRKLAELSVALKVALQIGE